MKHSHDGNKTPPTPIRIPVLMQPSPGVQTDLPIAAPLPTSRRTTRNLVGGQSSASLRPDAADADYVYFTNGGGGDLVPLDTAGGIPLIPPYGPDRDQEYHPIRLYHVDGIDWAVCDDCALERFPRVFEGSRIVARVGCAHCRCKNAIQNDQDLLQWMLRNRARSAPQGVKVFMEVAEEPESPRGA